LVRGEKTGLGSSGDLGGSIDEIRASEPVKGDVERGVFLLCNNRGGKKGQVCIRVTRKEVRRIINDMSDISAEE